MEGFNMAVAGSVDVFSFISCTSAILRDINLVSVMVRIILSISCGGVIGIERGVKGRAAGFRTHILVCMGSALTMMTGQYINNILGAGDEISRIGAQVVSGIGFLGVGTIITTKSSKVKGLTTAAGLWSLACLGLAIGIGFYEAAILGTIMVVVAMNLFQRVDKFFYRKSKIHDYYIEVHRIKTVREIMKNLRNSGYEILSLEYESARKSSDEPLGMIMTVNKKENEDFETLMEIVSGIKDVLFIEEL